ncbi:hypothetical protein ALSL_0429 [Aerosticca soli]|uniref:Uncharacterized protein n=1 Tax=Aerosticca soli TaxID=2010829 RepID=A0A2Z6E235_9GAMM|nr:hypothetical protein ALSL_0429 [Aerosticca soli]
MPDADRAESVAALRLPTPCNRVPRASSRTVFFSISVCAPCASHEARKPVGDGPWQDEAHWETPDPSDVEAKVGAPASGQWVIRAHRAAFAPIIARIPSSIRHLARTAALAAILTGAGGLGGAPHATTGRAELGCHPSLGTELTGQETGHVQIRIQLRPVQAQACRRNFDAGQILGRGVCQALDQTRRKADLHARVELHNHARCTPVVTGGHDITCLAVCLGALLGLDEAVFNSGHEFPSIRRIGRRDDRSGSLGYGPRPIDQSHNSRAGLVGRSGNSA